MNFGINRLALIIIPIILLGNLSCSREDPAVVSNDQSINSLNPISVYNLEIPEPSGIAYNSKRNSLFIVSDGRTDIYETDFTGAIKGTIPTKSTDLEGIAFSFNCDTIYVVEETKQLVSIYTLSGNLINSFPVNVATNPSHALEGITRNNINGHLIVLNEKLPCMLLEFNNTTEIRRKEINYTTDISDIYYEQSTNLFWIVSHESQKILKLTSDFTLISEWLIPVIQAEGITIVQDKIYVVSDSESKLFIFQKPI